MPEVQTLKLGQLPEDGRSPDPAPKVGADWSLRLDLRPVRRQKKHRRVETSPEQLDDAAARIQRALGSHRFPNDFKLVEAYRRHVGQVMIESGPLRAAVVKAEQLLDYADSVARFVALCAIDSDRIRESELTALLDDLSKLNLKPLDPHSTLNPKSRTLRLYEYAASCLKQYRNEIKELRRRPGALLSFLDEHCEPQLGILISRHPRRDELIEYLLGDRLPPSRDRKAPHTWVAAELAVENLRDTTQQTIKPKTFLENYVHARKTGRGKTSRPRKSSGPKPTS